MTKKFDSRLAQIKDDLRTHALRVKFTEADIKLLKRAATAAGMSLTDYCRSRLLEAANDTIKIRSGKVL